MADELPRPPPAPRFLTPAVALPRIQAIVSNASTIWFSQIGYLAFITVTLLSVRDLDFFSATARISLPLLGVTIPTETFFYIAPWLAAVLHVYFHLFLLKLWDAVAEAAASVGSLPLAERVAPWLVVDWAIRRRPDYRRATTQRPMNLLGSAVTGFLIWLATPILIAVFWWRSMPAHDARLTLAIGAALIVSLFTSLRAWRRARQTLQSPGISHGRMASRRAGSLPRLDRAARGLGALALSLAMLGAVPLVVGASLVGAGWHHLPAWVDYYADRFWRDHGAEVWSTIPRLVRESLLSIDRTEPPLVVASLIGADIAQLPADWRDHEVARRRFKVTWCRDLGLPAWGCERPEHPDQLEARQRWCDTTGIARRDCLSRFATIDTAFEQEWHRERASYFATSTGPDLRGRDIRGAKASDAFLSGVDLRDAQLGFAVLTSSMLERTYLQGSDLSHANLTRAHLQTSYLFQTNMTEAILVGARLRNSFIVQTKAESADFSGAQLHDSVLIGSTFKSANFADVAFGTILVHGSDFTGALNITQDQLSLAIGDMNTILPLDSLTVKQLYVLSCLSEPNAALVIILNYLPHHLQKQIETNIICPPGTQPQKVGKAAG
jgi:uncharacterized protein YjbI with pentapeptide repeats